MATNNHARAQEHQLLKSRMVEALKSLSLRRQVSEDFALTFHGIGLEKMASEQLSHKVILKMRLQSTLEATEWSIASILRSTNVGGISFADALRPKLREREQKIVGQIGRFVRGIKGKVLDFGCGSGEIAQTLHDKYSIDIEGVDVRDFRTGNVKIPFLHFEGDNVPVQQGYYDAAVLITVIHHDANNERILKELTRIVKNKLVVIETVPEDASKEAWGRTFLSDVLWNRIFNYGADIPVPGTYETADNWAIRFRNYGWKLTRQDRLGYDQKTAMVLHYRMIFEH